MKNGEETLDPSDWTEARAIAHRMVEDAVRHLDEVRERHVWCPASAPMGRFEVIV